MKDLRERCLRIANTIELDAVLDQPAELDVIACADILEQFAILIRNEALEVVQNMIGARAGIYLHGEPEKSELLMLGKEIRALKTEGKE